jgi:8-oxo-dGTP pyrophosphatase MutT (NUDIX family)
MDKFSRLKPKSDIPDEDENVLYSDDHLKLIQFEDWSIIKEPDYVVCIIYLIEMNQIIIRQEYIPTFKYVDGQEYHITVISGSIEVGETPQTAILREIEEEAGIVISPDFNIEFMTPVYISKSNSAKYHPAIITLTERDYHEIVASGDGSKAEELSKSVKVDLKYINSIISSDLITEFMLMKVKEYLNINGN